MVLQWEPVLSLARYYGAKNSDNLHKAIHTTVAFGFVAGSVLTVVGMYFCAEDPGFDGNAGRGAS